MSRLVVNFPALQQAAADIGGALNKMNQSLGDCQSAAAPLVQDWEGAAREAYEVRQQRWTSAANEIATMLNEIKRAVEESAEEYQQTEQRNTNMFT